ncbi:MAG: DNA polymerase IV, partial [Planctomycetota bacterium]
MRKIIHVDMDAFYASVEELDDPSLKGKPVIVGGDRGARGVVSAASYAARRHGVRSAMPLRTAARLCPRGIFLPVRMQRYLEVSRQVFAILRRFSPLVEPLSVDEAFLDLTGTRRLLGEPAEAARALRAAIRAEAGLTASVGLAPNKFVAKIASDLRKPDALVVVPPPTVRGFLAPLAIERMWGVGPKGAEALRRQGIATFGHLAACDPRALRARFGAASEGWATLARGEDSRPVVPERPRKSLGAEVTFPQDLSDPGELHDVLVSLCDRVASRLRSEELHARTVAVKVRYAPFETVTRRRTLPEPTCVISTLLETAAALLQEAGGARRGPVRLLGVSCSGFSGQALLFATGDRPRAADVEIAVDRVRARFGADALRRGSV